MKLKSFLDLKDLYDGMLEAKPLPQVNLCNCVGPEKGEKLCKCARENETLPEGYADRLEKTGRSGG